MLTIISCVQSFVTGIYYVKAATIGGKYYYKKFQTNPPAVGTDVPLDNSWNKNFRL